MRHQKKKTKGCVSPQKKIHAYGEKKGEERISSFFRRRFCGICSRKVREIESRTIPQKIFAEIEILSQFLHSPDNPFNMPAYWQHWNSHIEDSNILEKPFSAGARLFLSPHKVPVAVQKSFVTEGGGEELITFFLETHN